MLFRYKGYLQSGKKISKTIEANTITEAKSKLKQQNIFITEIKEQNFRLSNKFNIFFQKRKIKPIILSNISKDLSIYLSSGISLLDAIKLIAQRYKNNKSIELFFVSIIEYLDEGKNFYTALQMQKHILLPEFYLQSIKISEDGGMLSLVLDELSSYLQEQDKLTKQINSAIAYPVFIMVVSFFMVGFMLSFVVPKITKIFQQTNQELPYSTQLVIDIANFVTNNYNLIIATIVAFIAGAIFCLKRFQKVKYIFDTILLKIPFLKGLIELTELSRFAYINSILIRSGVPIVQSFKLSSNILKNSVIKKIFTEASQKVVEGQRLSNYLQNNKIYKLDSAFIQAVAIGEETSKLNIILENLSKLYANQNKNKISILLSLLEPMFMLIVGGIIGFIVVAMLMPIFSMSIG